MTSFVDTSALFALLDRDDANHGRAARFLREAEPQERLLTHSYVLVETTALTHARLGVAAVRALHLDLGPLLDVEWVGEPVHRAAMTALIAAGRRRVSLVDRVSFEVMRAQGVERAFAFDPNFRREGFDLVP